MRKGKKAGRCLCAILAAAAMAVGVPEDVPGGIGLTMKVEAAQVMQVSELAVTALPGGISARCVYQELDSALYSMQLYLEQMDQSGSFVPAAYRELPSTSDVETAIETAPIEAESGIYRAVLLMRSSSGEQTTVRFRDSGLYNVVKAGDQYEVSPRRETEEQQIHGGWEESENDREAFLCMHSPAYSLYKEATPQSDAVLEEHCERCGQHMSYQEVPNSAYVSFLDEAAERIQDAGWGEQVVISTDRWISFDRRVFDRLAEREDVSVLVEYRYEGSDFAVLLPAGTNMEEVLDENGFCGFRYLASLFGDYQGKIDG
ncbi:MAG: hypothetical protein Q4D94_07225 [Bacillota bacterium]|nr:hypothetical protein [Bacillota bacterium]